MYSIADIPPAMALGVEPNEKDLMQRNPRDPKMGVITKLTWIIIFINSMLIALLSLASYCISFYWLKFPIDITRSMVRKKLKIHSINILLTL